MICSYKLLPRCSPFIYTSDVFWRIRAKFGSLLSFFKGSSTNDLDLTKLVALRRRCFYGVPGLDGILPAGVPGLDGTFPAGDGDAEDGMDGLILMSFLFRFMGACLNYYLSGIASLQHIPILSAILDQID